MARNPVPFKYGGGIIVLSDVSAILCGSNGDQKFCHVQFRSGASIRVDITLSSALIQSVEACYREEGVDVMTIPKSADPSRRGESP